MQIKHYLAGLVLLAYSSYSYSETIYGVTQNAANPGLEWVMTNVLPQQAGLTVNTVIYRYTTEKQPEDDMLVHVQNENAQGNGYIFRETDDWSGLPGNTINKAVPVLNIPRELWGLGSIEVKGEGSVTDPFVSYAYSFDPCFDPQSSPDCPGWKDPTLPMIGEPEVIDPLDEDLIQNELDRKATLRDEDEDERERKRFAESEDKEEERLSNILGIGNRTELAGAAQMAYAGLVALDTVPANYLVSLPTTTYEETTILIDAKLPMNPRASRVNYAQDKLHNELVEMQYNKK